MSIYGYCRISTKKQKLKRQVDNIKAEYPTAVIVEEAYTGTKINRKEFNKILKAVKTGDTIVFDSVSRMSRNAEEGVKLYMELFDKGVNLVFLKEHYIDTDTYKNQLQNRIQMTGTNIDVVLQALNEYFKLLAADQIKIAFDQAQKEVDDLHKKTSEGIDKARLEGKQIGLKAGAKLTTKKSKDAKKIIRQRSKTFGGSLTDKDVIALAKITEKTYYKYKKELLAELQAEQEAE